MNPYFFLLFIPAVVACYAGARFGMWLGTRIFRKDDAFISPRNYARE